MTSVANQWQQWRIVMNNDIMYYYRSLSGINLTNDK